MVNASDRDSDDYVIATGKNYSIRQFVEECFKYHNIYIEWEGQGIKEIGVDRSSGKIIVKVDSRYYRPAEVEQLLGDSTKAFKNSIGFQKQILKI